MKKYDEDICQECSTNYVITSDGLKCLKKIINCKVHNTVGSNTEESSC